ncbi:hypothetical protein VTH82DRAFT_2453 [Thermothelomyces myriococcoides]
MRASSTAAGWRSAAVAVVLALAPAAAAAAKDGPSGVPAQLDCENIVTDQGHTYNLRPLAGPHVVVTHEYTRPTYHNTSYAVDVCGVLKTKGKAKEEERCPAGTRGMFCFFSFFSFFFFFFSLSLFHLP